MSTLESIYSKYSEMVYNVALHYTQHAHDAEDIAQDVFVKIHANLNKFDKEKASIKTWIYQIAINQSLDFLKSKKAKKRFGNVISFFGKHEETLQNIKSEFKHPGILTEHKEELQILFQALNQIPENQRTAIILTRIEGRSQKEVAEIMNIGVKAVESLLQRAKLNLVKKLSEKKENSNLIVLVLTQITWI